MSAEHTPLSIKPTGTADHIGYTEELKELNIPRMDVYAEPDVLPGNPDKRAICLRHLMMGLQEEMMGKFYIQGQDYNGCDYDTAMQEGLVRIQFSCGGQSKILKHCGLTLTQYDSEGNKLNTGKLGRRID